MGSDPNQKNFFEGKMLLKMNRLAVDDKTI